MVNIEILRNKNINMKFKDVRVGTFFTSLDQKYCDCDGDSMLYEKLMPTVVVDGSTDTDLALCLDSGNVIIFDEEDPVRLMDVKIVAKEAFVK